MALKLANGVIYFPYQRLPRLRTEVGKPSHKPNLSARKVPHPGNLGGTAAKVALVSVRILVRSLGRFLLRLERNENGSSLTFSPNDVAKGFTLY